MKAKYDHIGSDYNNTRQADPYLVSRLFDHLKPDPAGKYLDIGCGTGNYTIAIQKKGVDFIGIDPSESMLEKARQRNRQITWKQGTAEKTELPAESVDGIIASLTIHHWENLNVAFAELFRVLKPGGRIVIFTSTPDQMQGYWLRHYFPRMLTESMVQMPSLESTVAAMESAGFTILHTEPYSVRSDLRDLFLYSGKYDPELYFKQEVRSGISSFSALANAEEVAAGLKQLRKDIDNRKVDQVMKSFENKGGDYLFVVGQKNN